MNRFRRGFCHFLLFALVGWAGVDDYFPSACGAADSRSETGESVFFDGAGCRSQSATDRLSSTACHSRTLDQTSDLTGIRLAALSAGRLGGASNAEHLYALMSLRR
ncbi:MAG TPA: hypothetical protein VGP63_07810 [Planctomycetaceae bacterium]|nr:hypothetical protein [Planctomycetaceae bacterium]